MDLLEKEELRIRKRTWLVRSLGIRKDNFKKDSVGGNHQHYFFAKRSRECSLE